MLKADDLVNIKDFASLVGKSQQAIYQQIKTRLEPYSVISEGKRLIKVQAAIDIYGITFAQLEKADFSSDCKDLPNDNDVYRLLQTTIDTLQQQLQNKDKMIEQLQSELAAERAHNREQADKLAVLVSQAQTLQKEQLQLLTVDENEGAPADERLTPAPRRSLWQKIFHKRG